MRPIAKPIRHFVLICVLVEFAALLGQLGGLGGGVRNLLVAVGAFWPTLLSGDAGGYPLQPYLMFATSVFVHGNPLHLMMNMIGLMYVGPMVVERVGARGFWPVAGLSALGAGLIFAWMASGPAPMVGASGVLFGFLGAVGVWAVRDRLALGAPLQPLVAPTLAFVGLNVALTLAAGGIAWQAHLGGAVGGAVAGLIAWKPPRAVAWRRL